MRTLIMKTRNEIEIIACWEEICCKTLDYESKLL